MTKPIIWYLHHYSGSPSVGMSYRPYYLSQEFNKQGCKAHVIGSSFHHLLNKTVNIKKQVEQIIIDDQSYIFLNTPHYKGNIKRFWNMLSYSWKIWRYQKNLVSITGIPSVIIVSSTHPFHYFSARSISKKYKAKLIFEVRDLWPLSLIDLMDFSSIHPIVLFMNYIERKAYCQSDYVVSLLPYAFSYMNERGLTKERFVYIPNGASALDLSELSQPSISEYIPLILQKKQQGKFIMGYVGAHGVPNSLDDLIKALILLKQQNITHIHVFLIGDGIQKKELQALSEEAQLESVTFLPPVPKKQILSILEFMDAVYLGWKNRSIYQYGVSPNKLFDYMLSGKPILHAFTAKNDIVQETKSGITVNAENPAEIAEGLKRISVMPQPELELMGKNGKESLLSRYTYEYLAKKYMELF